MPGLVRRRATLLRLYCSLLLLGFLISACAAKVSPCPKGCQCVGFHPDFGDCKVTVLCERIKAFPSSADYPKDLDCLFMSAPKLSKLNASAKDAGIRAFPTSIRRLDLNQCGLGELPVGDAIGRLRELRVLNLEFNKLKTLPREAFHGLDKLKVLWLTGNHYHPDEKEYKKMRALGNNLNSLDSEQFSGLKNLQVLLIHHNRLKVLPQSIFADQGRLRVLKLLDNPFMPRLTRDHAAFRELLSRVPLALTQLDIDEDSGDDLEDMWEETKTYLSDDFDLTTAPRHREL
eukprot:TRINITY_DN51185_c0_g1_i1.p1 TRINITY_DN51185_c0_g1~~TRINITY_DN51185_c0_g1_i1.p1  ORF type:complete len:309 (+),score=40.85 TRINITY_DN51185_c0_g1_i1:65-928(+)